ncbi:hypothetical protein [Nocardia sp. NPDC048505]|uniref:hypothetical protein n=1 Tax=unclassified Nocardia TaxID=2637762 RepID=UPI0033E828E4
MSAPPTGIRQRNAVSEGAALGLLLNGRISLPHDKVGVAAAFETAWQAWPFRSRFPQIGIDLGHGLNGLHAMTTARSHTPVWAVYWRTYSDALLVHSREPDWDIGNRHDLDYVARMIARQIPIRGWKNLAADILRLLPG